jgi:hypothetical protein
MSGEYRADAKDWEMQGEWACISEFRTARCLLELRSRVELLEATQHAHLDASQLSEAEREALTEPGRVVTDRPEPAPVATDQVLYQLYDSTGPTVVDAFRAIYDLGRQHGARAAATEADNATAATVAEIRSLLFKDDAQPAPAVKDSLTAAPAGSLVETVAKAIHPDRCADPNLYLHESRAAIREVADWFRNQRDSPETAAALEQEASQ